MSLASFQNLETEEEFLVASGLMRLPIKEKTTIFFDSLLPKSQWTRFNVRNTKFCKSVPNFASERHSITRVSKNACKVQIRAKTACGIWCNFINRWQNLVQSLAEYSPWTCQFYRFHLQKLVLFTFKLSLDPNAMKINVAFWASTLVPLCCQQELSQPMRQLWRETRRVVVWWGTTVKCTAPSIVCRQKACSPSKTLNLRLRPARIAARAIKWNYAKR